MSAGAEANEPHAALLATTDEPRSIDLNAKLLSPDAKLDELKSILEDDAVVEWYRVDTEQERLTRIPEPDEGTPITVAIRRRPRGTAAWKPFLSDLGLPLSQGEAEESESAIIVVRTGSDAARTVLWCFGTAGQSIPQDMVDGRFGLITALNKHAANDDRPWRLPPSNMRRRRSTGDDRTKVRQIQADSRGGYRHSLTAKSPSGSPVAGLGFDTVTDLLRGLRVFTDDDLIPDLTGGRGLRFNTYLQSWEDFAALTDYVLELRDRTTYQEDWYWIDYIVPVTPRSEVERLVGVLFELIESDENTAVDLVLPEFTDDDGAQLGRIHFGLGHEDPIRSPVEWKHVRNQLVRIHPTGNPLRRTIKFRAGDSKAPLRASLIELLVAEFTDGGRQYILSDGELLTVDMDFLGRIDRELSELTWSTFPFPTYAGGTERSYLESADRRSARLVMLDQDNIRLPGETPFEPCDLFSDDGRLIFAKLKGRSSTFSHLCTQAEVAAEMLSRHDRAREEFLAKISARAVSPSIETSALEAMSHLEVRQPDSVTVTLLILGAPSAEGVQSLPLLSRVRLLRASQRLTDLGFRFEIAWPAAQIPTQRRAAESPALQPGKAP